MAYNSSAEIVSLDISGEDPWFPYRWKNGEVFPLAVASTDLKRRRGVDGTYLNETFVVPGVPVVTWKIGVSFFSTEDCERTVAVFDNERRATEENWRISKTASDGDVLNFSITENNRSVEIVELTAESESLRVRVFDLEPEKEVYTEKISRMVAEAEVNSTVVTRLKAEKAASEVKVADLTAKAGVLTTDMSRISAKKQALQVRTASLDATKMEKTELLETLNNKVRALKTELDERNRELDTLKKSARRAEKVLADPDSRRSDNVSYGALMNMASVSSVRIRDTSDGGWRDRRDKALVSVIGKCVAYIQNKLSQSDNSTQIFCCWIEQMV